MADLWECDGCGFTGTEAEVGAHVIQVNTLPNGELKDVPDVVCWGSMKVGESAWVDYHIHGVHPMDTIADRIVEDLRRFEG